MLLSYLRVYELAVAMQHLRTRSEFFSSASWGDSNLYDGESDQFDALLRAMKTTCPEFGLVHTAALAEKAAGRKTPKVYRDLLAVLMPLDDSISHELGQEAVFRIPADRKGFYGQDHLLGNKVAGAFPSCAHDIRKAGDCYAFGLEDACVHHLMLVLERGLNALAARVGVTLPSSGWQEVINAVKGKLNNIPRGPEREFLEEVNSEFGFLKVAYRNHSEHAHDDPYDLEKALSILNHVRAFMKALEKGGLAET